MTLPASTNAMRSFRVTLSTNPPSMRLSMFVLPPTFSPRTLIVRPLLLMLTSNCTRSPFAIVCCTLVSVDGVDACPGTNTRPL